MADEATTVAAATAAAVATVFVDANDDKLMCCGNWDRTPTAPALTTTNGDGSKVDDAELYTVVAGRYGVIGCRGPVNPARDGKKKREKEQVG